MRQLFFTGTVTCCLYTVCYSQTSIEFVPAVGYNFNYTMYFSKTTGRLDPGINYGGTMLFNVSRRFGVELLYNRVEAAAKLYSAQALPGEAPIYETRAGINYVLAGLVTNFPVAARSPVNLFFGFDLGLSVATPSPDEFASNINFAMSLQGGANIYLSPRFGIKLGARITESPHPASDYYFGHWGGSSGFLAVLSPGLIVGSVNLGLIIGLGNEMPDFQKIIKKSRKRRNHRKMQQQNFQNDSTFRK